MYLLIAFGVLVISLIVWVAKLSQRLRALTSGAQGISLEAAITDNHRTLSELQEELHVHRTKIGEIDERVQKSIQHVGVVRFNPYKETGGNQSFAVALTNEHNNGVILSSLYTRDHVHIFAKSIEDGESVTPLSKEERQALKHTKTNI